MFADAWNFFDHIHTTERIIFGLPTLAHLLALGGYFRFHLDDQRRQFFLALRFAVGVDVARMTFAVGVGRGVAPFPQMLADLRDTARAALALFALCRGERGRRQRCFCGGFRRRFRIPARDALVDLSCRLLLHGGRDVGVDVQRRRGGDVSDDRRERLDVHAVLQGFRGEGVAQVVKTHELAARALEHELHLRGEGGRVARRVLRDRRGEHPARAHGFPVRREDAHDARRQEERAEARVGFWRRDEELALRAAHGAADAQLPRLKVEVVPLERQQLAAPQSY